MFQKFATKVAALTAMLGLGVTALSGAPAQAADTAGIRFAPEYGTSLVMPAGTVFSLKEAASSEIPESTYSTLKFKVTNNDGVAASVLINGVAPAENTRVLYTTGGQTDTVLGSSAGDSATFGYAAPGGGDEWIGVSTIGNLSTFRIVSSDATKSASYSVTAFYDMNGNGLRDGSEFSNTQTVKFQKASDLSVTTTLTPSPIYEGTTELSSNVRIGVNYDQVTRFGNTFDFEQISVLLSDGTGAASNNPYQLAWGEWDGFGNFTNDWTVDPLVGGGPLVKVQAFWNGEKIGTPALSAVIRPSTGDVTAEVVKSKVAKNVSGGDNAFADVAVNSEYTVKAVVNDTSVPAKPLAGRTVFYQITSSRTLSADNNVTVKLGDRVFTSGSTVTTSSTISDATGMVSLKLSTTGFEAGDYLTIQFQSENVQQYIRLTQRAFEYTGYITNFNTVFTDAYHINRGYLEGATATVDLEVYDQFGAFIEDGWTARALLVDSYRPDGGTDATSTTNSIVPIVGGKATMTITDNGKGLGWNWYEIEFIKRDLRNYEFDMDTQNTVSNFWFNIRNAEDLVPGKVTINSAAKDSSGTWQLNSGSFGASDNPIAVSTSDFGNWDSRDLLATEPTLQSRATFSGQIETLSTATYMSTYVSSPLVTIEGEGLQFNFGDDMLSAVQTEKASFYATETGSFWFQASSHITGEHTIKVTVGEVVSYVQFHVAPPLPDAGSKVVVTAPDWSLPGKTVVVSAVISDKFGNLVPTDDRFTMTIKASASNYSTSYGTGEDGYNSVGISMGTNDIGVLEVLANYDYNDDGDLTDASDIVYKKPLVVSNGATVPADAKLVVFAPKTSQSGRVVDGAATLTTASGEPIAFAQVTFTAVGAGYVLPVTVMTDYAGRATYKLITSNNEVGDAIVTATAGSVTGSATVTFGVTDASLNIVGKRVTADWSFALGKRVVVYRDGVQILNFVATSDAAGSLSFNLKRGTHSVKIKIGGETIDSQVYKVR